MGVRSLLIGFVGLVVLLASVSACSRDEPGAALARDCQPLAAEDEILASYQADPVFAVTPPGAVPNGRPRAEHGCHQLTSTVMEHGRPVERGDITITAVRAFFALNVSFSQEQLTALYDPGIRAAGWAPEPLDLVKPVTGEQQAGLYYCKLVHDAPSFLSVLERWVGPEGGTATATASVFPSSGPWPEAGTLEVRITAIRGMSCTASGDQGTSNVDTAPVGVVGLPAGSRRQLAARTQ
jgi:hypothetical protein